jgi:hypothetical protein
MRTMLAKFPGVCRDCGKAINRGQMIKFHGRGHATHANCFEPNGETPIHERKAPCWICQNPEGKFRAMGAATPVWCDTCFEVEKDKGRNRFSSRSTYARFSSGAEVYTNRNGRCEDAPCCGCCS